MPSTVIRAFDYDAERNELTVTFVTGRIYLYALVPPDVAAAMRSALSKGTYFNREIRNRYPARELTGADAVAH